jgi:diaminohydroxyphosphoribosylaminopyrimidine deaminase/5-amino-6-(5-phosphoribosylamino)uracil reductase
MRFTPRPQWNIDRQFSSIEALLGTLWNEGHNGLLVEGGGKTISQFLNAGFVDEIVLYIAPIILGDGPTWVSDLGVNTLVEAPSFVLANSTLLSESDIQPNMKMTLYSRNLSNFLTSE